MNIYIYIYLNIKISEKTLDICGLKTKTSGWKGALAKKDFQNLHALVQRIKERWSQCDLFGRCESMRETCLALPANRSTKFHKLIPQSRRGFQWDWWVQGLGPVSQCWTSFFGWRKDLTTGTKCREIPISWCTRNNHQKTQLHLPTSSQTQSHLVTCRPAVGDKQIRSNTDYNILLQSIMLVWYRGANSLCDNVQQF